MATLLDAAQRAMDLYYQDYSDRINFIDIDDFKYQIAINYSEMLNTLYQKARADGKKEEAFANVENSAAWLISDALKVEHKEDEGIFFIRTKHDVFSFDFDGNANALQDVRGVKNTSRRFRKISLNDRKFIHVLPTTNKVYYYLNSANEIVFDGKVSEGEEVTVQYIPKVVGSENDCLLSDNIIGDVITKTLTLMFGAKNGNVIDESNDGNRNAVLQQQVNPQLTKTQQT